MTDLDGGKYSFPEGSDIICDPDKECTVGSFVIAKDIRTQKTTFKKLTIGAYDVHLGDIGGVPFYISASQYEYWKHTQLIIDVIDGHGGTFSLEGSTGKAFHTRSRLFTDDEIPQLQAQGLI